jgi:hypothetical protein
MFMWDYAFDTECTTVNGNGWGPCMQIFSLSPQMLHVLQNQMSGSSLASLADCRQTVTQSPEFVRILQAQWLLHGHEFSTDEPCPSQASPRPAPTVPDPHEGSLGLYHIRLLLGVSWNDILAALSVLRSLIGGGSRKQVSAGALCIVALSAELYPTSAPSVAKDLAVEILRLIQRIGARDLPLNVW